MNRNPLGLISLFCLVVTLLWIALLLVGVATSGPVETLEQALAAASTLFLSQMLQQWPGSVVSIVNNLAYAVLGISSIIFGLILYRRIPSLRLTGALLTLSGLASIVGMAGIVLRSALLENGSLVGGVSFCWR
jgi:hypothetical protein